MQGRSPCPRSAERGTLLCFIKRRRGSKGEPSPGVPPSCFSPCTCAPIRWEGVVALSCLSTPFLWCLPKETVSSRQRKALFLPWRLHHSRERYKSVVYTFLARLGEGAGGLPGAQVSLTQSAVMLGLRVRGRGGRDRTAAVAAPKSAFLWGSTPFLCARAKKWGGTGSRGERLLPKKTAHTHPHVPGGRRNKKRRPVGGVFFIYMAYFFISGLTVSGSAVMVMVNLMPSLSAKLESQSRKSRTCASVPALNILWKLSMKMWEMS